MSLRRREREGYFRCELRDVMPYQTQLDVTQGPATPDKSVISSHFILCSLPSSALVILASSQPHCEAEGHTHLAVLPGKG